MNGLTLWKEIFYFAPSKHDVFHFRHIPSFFLLADTTHPVHSKIGIETVVADCFVHPKNSCRNCLWRFLYHDSGL
jgi:hypothetical protein